MKSITIRLFDVEAAMLVEVQKHNKDFRDPQVIFARWIQEKYAKLHVKKL